MLGIRKNNHGETDEKIPTFLSEILLCNVIPLLCVSEIGMLSVNPLRPDTPPVSGFNLVTSWIPRLQVQIWHHSKNLKRVYTLRYVLAFSPRYIKGF
jgi:hypothetical protein